MHSLRWDGSITTASELNETCERPDPGTELRLKMVNQVQLSASDNLHLTAGIMVRQRLGFREQCVPGMDGLHTTSVDCISTGMG